MFLKVFILLVFCYVPVVYATFYKNNVTDYNTCEIFYSRFESAYKTYFAIPPSTDPNQLMVDLHIAVLAVSDAHILLSTTPDVRTNDPAYEIVIGAGGNTFSDIRRKQKANVRVSYRKRGILSAVDITGFWIHIYTSGVIDVGKEGEEVAFMTWTDTELLPVKYYSFTGWGTVELKWYHNCPRPNENATEVMKVIPTEIERLRDNILNTNDSHNNFVRINIQFTSQFVSLNEKSAVLNLKGRANFTWMFSPIKWNPANFSGIQSVVMQHNEIWKPEMVVTNGIDNDHREPFIGNNLIANYNGQIVWQPFFDMSTFCSLDGIENWPNDVHECEVFLSTSFSQNDNVRFVVTDPSETIKFHENNYDSEWCIEEGPNIHIYHTSNPEYSSDKYIKTPTQLKLRFTIKRKTSLYDTAFKTPLIIICTMMLGNFWCSSFDYIKISLIAAQFVLTTMGSIALAIVLPAHATIVPIIVYQYSAIMLANILNLIISVIVINISRNKQLYEPSHVIGRIVKHKYVEKLLLLPDLTPQIISSPYPAAMETTRRRTRVQDVWIRLAMCIDRLSFIVYFGLTMSLIIFQNKTNMP